MLYETLALVSVAFLWGATNPLIKKNSASITQKKSDSKIGQFILDIKYLITNKWYLIPLAINQLGSVIYFFALQNVDLSLAVPVSNSLTFVFTALASWILLGEKLPNRSVLIGIIFILIGTSLVCYDKLKLINL